MKEITNPGFRYTFSQNPFMIIEGLEEGLYGWDGLVVRADRWGGIRLADQTQVNNLNRLAKTIERSKWRKHESFR